VRSYKLLKIIKLGTGAAIEQSGQPGGGGEELYHQVPGHHDQALPGAVPLFLTFLRILGQYFAESVSISINNLLNRTKVNCSCATLLLCTVCSYEIQVYVKYRQT
jgi:hypothetical protein